MNKQRQLILAGSALVVVISAAFGLSFAGREETPAANKVELASSQTKREQNDCASPETYAGLKEVAFEAALKGRTTDPADLITLATHSVVRMENPVVESRDEKLGMTVCSGTFVIELPPGAERGFGGQRRLMMPIEYTAQAAADGSGLVYQLNGAEPLVRSLAAFDLQGQRYVRPMQTEVLLAEAVPPPLPGMGGPEEAMPAADEERARPVVREEVDARSREERQQRLDARAARLARAEREQEQQARAARAERVKSAERKARAERTQRAEARPARGNSRPSFNCRHAKTRSERMVCGSGSLAARDRQMSSQFHAALADADRRTRRQLQRSRDRFLAYRERCRSEECVADAYEGRMREIDDIMVAE